MKRDSFFESRKFALASVVAGAFFGISYLHYSLQPDVTEFTSSAIRSLEELATREEPTLLEAEEVIAQLDSLTFLRLHYNDIELFAASFSGDIAGASSPLERASYGEEREAILKTADNLTELTYGQELRGELGLTGTLLTPLLFLGYINRERRKRVPQ